MAGIVNWGTLKPNGVMDAFDAAEERSRRTDDREYQRGERDYVRRKRGEAESADAAVRGAALKMYPDEPASAGPVAAPTSPAPSIHAQVPVPAPSRPMLPTGATSAGGDAGQLQQLTAGQTPQAPAVGGREYMQSEASNTPPPPPMPAAPIASNVRPAAAPPAQTVVPPPGSSTPTRAAQPSGMGTMIRTLAGTPGTGESLLHMMTADQQATRQQSQSDQRLKIEMEKEVYNHIRNGDWGVAQSISQRYGLGIPDQVFQNRGAQQALTRGANTAAKLMGTKGTFEQHMTFAMEYAKVLSAGGSEDQAVQTASAAAMKMKPVGEPFKVHGQFTGPDNQVNLIGSDGTIKPSGYRARPPGTGRGGSGGGATSATERIVDNIIADAEERGEPISYAEAVRRAKGGNNDNMAKERLAALQARADPASRRDRAGTLDRWRRQYGLSGPAPSIPDEQAPAAPAAGAPAPAARPAAAAQPVREYLGNGRFR